MAEYFEALSSRLCGVAAGSLWTLRHVDFTSVPGFLHESRCTAGVAATTGRHHLAQPALPERRDSFLLGQWLGRLPGAPGCLTPTWWGPTCGGEDASPPSFLSQDEGCSVHPQPRPERKTSGSLLLKVSMRHRKPFPECPSPHKYAFLSCFGQFREAGEDNSMAHDSGVCPYLKFFSTPHTPRITFVVTCPMSPQASLGKDRGRDKSPTSRCWTHGPEPGHALLVCLGLLSPSPSCQPGEVDVTVPTSVVKEAEAQRGRVTCPGPTARTPALTSLC